MLKMDVVPGANVPICKEDGNYEANQYNGMEGYCVEAETGVEVRVTRYIDNETHA